MKLPEEMNKLDECELIEAIVRHCAKICAGLDTGYDTYDFQRASNQGKQECREAILKAFDLEEKK